MNKIFCFTGSGNSLAIANRIAGKLENCEVIRITAKFDFSKVIDADILGFVLPVYAWGMPNFLKKFLKQINVSKANYVFVITNFAGSGGNTLGSVRKILQKKKLITNAFGEITMPNNYVVMGNASTDSVARSILQTANQKIDQLREKISAKESLPFPKKNIFDKFFTSLIHPLFALTVQHTDKKFFSTDKCIGCGICEKVCPVNNITLNSDKKPLWLHKCEQCHACFHWCPSKAIEFNKKTYGKNRYTHPDISLKEMLA